MATTHEERKRNRERTGGGISAWDIALAVVLALVFGFVATEANARGPRICSQTAGLQYVACGAEAKDDLYEGRAKCLQIGDAGERGDCIDEARGEYREARALCREQRVARRDLCAIIGEDRYEPDFDPANHVHDYTNPPVSNDYYPMTIGYTWSFETDGESNVIEILSDTKDVEGVTCLVFNDLVTKDDGGGEDTRDWYAQHLDGSVTYCGEDVRDFEVFPGDVPQVPELVAIDGSFKAGRDGDLAGTIFPAEPVVGMTYRQEWSAGNAEDAATVLSTTYSYGSDPALDAFVPQELAELLCANADCVVTGEFIPLEPDVWEHKYYARGIGLFLETKPDEGEVNQLVDCNFDARCATLPQP